MGVFRWPEDRGRLDFELLRESSAALYFSRGVLAEHVGWLRANGYAVHEFDCSGWSGERDFHGVVAAALDFPGYYGRNLNAFSDCLCAVDVPAEGGLVLAFAAFDRWFSAEPEVAWAALDIVARWSRFFLLEGKQLLSLVHSEDRDIRFPLVGARPVLWNSAERSAHAREQLAAARARRGPVPPTEG